MRPQTVWRGQKDIRLVVVMIKMMTHRWEHIGADIWEHMRADISKRTYESTHMRAHIWVHTYESTEESTHRRAHTWDHIGEHTYESTQTRAHMWKHTHESTQMRAHTWAQRRKTDSKTGKHTLCERARWKRRWTCHKSHFMWKYTGQMPDPKPARGSLCGNLQEKCRTQIPRSTFCARLRSRNAHGHFIGTILRGNWQEKCQTPRWTTPPVNTGPFTLTVRTPSVWAHCLGNNLTSWSMKWKPCFPPPGNCYVQYMNKWDESIGLLATYFSYSKPVCWTYEEHWHLEFFKNLPPSTYYEDHWHCWVIVVNFLFQSKTIRSTNEPP